ncbi:MAG: FadR family transcriptional regulator [Clostridiales Family XIII bacterium]|jgi:GntR family transcriptional repressor for pyruvate dehydrogenase complex|nr:FadR family transcriptional regulator [Clostridiales Family XIII bacterium]
MFDRLRIKTISEEITETILRYIYFGELTNGQKLPPERILADELGVSRSSLRSALRSLESIGYIVSVPGNGNYIHTNMQSGHKGLPDFRLTHNSRQVLDVINMRIKLETDIARLVAERATEAQIKEVRSALHRMRLEIEEGGLGNIGDARFHHKLATASQNQAYVITVQLLAELLFESRTATMIAPGRPWEAYAEHERILEAVQKHDPDEASKAMQTHLEMALDLLPEAHTAH